MKYEGGGSNWPPEKTTLKKLSLVRVNVDKIHKSCWYNLCINPADLFNDIFPICKVKWMETSLKIDQDISSFWLGYKIVFCKNKQTNKISTAQRGSKHDNMMNERRRQPSTGKKKKSTLADSNHFYIEESVTCTNCCAHVTLCACYVHDHNCARNLWKPVVFNKDRPKNTLVSWNAGDKKQYSSRWPQIYFLNQFKGTVKW